MPQPLIMKPDLYQQIMKLGSLEDFIVYMTQEEYERSKVVHDPTNADPTLAIFYDVQPNDSEQGDGK